MVVLVAVDQISRSVLLEIFQIHRMIFYRCKQLSNTDIANLAQKYDNICFYKGVSVSFRYYHNWTGDVTKAGELGGMHHDIMCGIEPLGLIQKLQMHPEEFYSGLAYFQGQWIKNLGFQTNGQSMM